MRLPIGKTAVGRAMSKTLNEYDRTPDLQEILIVNTGDLQNIADTLWINLDMECERLGNEREA